MQEQNGLR